MVDELGPFTEDDVEIIVRAFNLMPDEPLSRTARLSGERALIALAARLAATRRKVLDREPTEDMLNRGTDWPLMSRNSSPGNAYQDWQSLLEDSFRNMWDTAGERG